MCDRLGRSILRICILCVYSMCGFDDSGVHSYFVGEPVSKTEIKVKVKASKTDEATDVMIKRRIWSGNCVI